jgi:HEAT repeat protein
VPSLSSSSNGHAFSDSTRRLEVSLNTRGKSVGVFTTDRSLVVQSWDPWIADATGIPESAAYGQSIAHLFPELAERGHLARLRRVADGIGVEVLAPALHKYFLPCVPRDRTSRFERMRQHVTIAPLADRDGIAGVVVTIEDVTARFDREKRLAAELDSGDEAVRLRAAKALAAGGDSAMLLANALTDDSWRVRRVAAEGMAASGGRDVIDTLLEALQNHHRDPGLLNAALSALTRTRDDVVLSLVRLLDLDDVDLRTYAALALGLVRDPRAVPALIARLDDADANVRFHAIEALGRIGDRQAADAVVAIAETRDFFLAFAALDALAAIGDPHVAPRLLPLLDDAMLFPATIACLGAIGAEDVAVPLATRIETDALPAAPIALALASIQDRIESEIGEGALIADLTRSALTAESTNALIVALDGASDDELRGLITVLAWLPFDAVDPALARLLPRTEVRTLVAEAMARRGVAAAAFVENAARTGDEDVRKAAAFALGRIGSTQSVPLLSSWIHPAADAETLIAVAGALGAIGDRGGFTPLLGLLDHTEATVRQAAVAALNSIGHPQMEAAVAGRLSDPSPGVRESAARIAGYFGYISCLRRVVELCDDSAETVRRTAVEALANYDQRPAWSKIHETATSDSDPSVRAAAVRAFARSISDESLHALAAACRDSNLWVRYYAARALAQRQVAHADVLAALAECATRDPAVPVRIAAIETLGVLGAPSMIGVLVPLTRDLEPGVACAALIALGAFDVEPTSSSLANALDTDDDDRICAALEALGHQRSGQGVAAARTLALSGSDRTRRRAVQTLGEIGDAAAVRALGEVGTQPRMRPLVVAALARLAENEVELLRDELSSAPAQVRELIVEAMGRAKHPDRARSLAVALNDASPIVRVAAARALSRLDLRDARAQLSVLARTDESPAVRVAAERALSRDK